ncbi:M56 family metallopeptidase [Candidatus Latescibacterota bacterium]
MMSLIGQLSVIAAELAPLAVSFLWQSTLFILFAGAISILLRKRGPVIRLSLWVAVLLVIPLIPFTMQIANYVDAPTAELSVLPSAFYELSGSASVQEAEISQDIQPAASAGKTPFSSTNPYFFVLLIYAVGVGALFMGIVFATIRIWLWEITGKQLSHGRIVDIVNEYCRMFAIKNTVQVIEHSKVAVPCTTGIWRPVIFVPESYGEKLSEEQISSVICHECAHIKRHDVSILAVSTIIRGLIWIQPFVWMIQRQIAILAEQSADELVLATGTNPASYATTLTNIAQEHVLQHSKILSPIGFIDFRHTFLYRVRAILKYTKVDSMSWRGYALLAMSLLIMVSAVTVVPLTEQNVSAAVNADGMKTLNFVLKDLVTEKPIGDIELTATSRDTRDPMDRNDDVYELIGTVTADANGKATFKLPEIDMIIIKIGKNTNYFWAMTEPRISVGWYHGDQTLTVLTGRIKSDETVTLYLGQPNIVSGTVINPDGNPVAGATVDAFPADHKFQGGNSLTGDTRYSVKTDAAGKYSIGLPGDQEYGIMLIAHDGAYEEWRGLANGLSKPFDSKYIGNEEDVTIRLTRPCTINGIVKDINGKPVPYIAVVVKYPDGRYNRYYRPTANTDKNGHFSLRNVRAGELFIMCPRRHGIMYHPNKLKWPEGYIVPLTLSEGETVSNVEVLGLTVEEIKAIEMKSNKKSRPGKLSRLILKNRPRLKKGYKSLW